MAYKRHVKRTTTRKRPTTGRKYTRTVRPRKNYNGFSFRSRNVRFRKKISGVRKAKTTTFRRSGSAVIQKERLGTQLMSTLVKPELQEMYKRHSFNRSGMTNARCKNPRAPFADNYYCKFRYIVDALINVGGGGSNARPLRGNSIWDPDYALGGSSAAYCDTMGQLYLQYRVNACRIRVRAQTTNQSDNSMTLVLFKTIVDPSLWPTYIPTKLDTFRESGIPYKILNLTEPPGGKPFGTVTDYATTTDMFGYNNPDDFSEFCGQMPNAALSITGSDPQVVWYWGLTYFGYSGNAAATNDIIASVDLEYYTCLFSAPGVNPNPPPLQISKEEFEKVEQEPEPEPELSKSTISQLTKLLKRA